MSSNSTSVSPLRRVEAVLVCPEAVLPLLIGVMVYGQKCQRRLHLAVSDDTNSYGTSWLSRISRKRNPGRISTCSFRQVQVGYITWSLESSHLLLDGYGSLLGLAAELKNIPSKSRQVTTTQNSRPVPRSTASSSSTIHPPFPNLGISVPPLYYSCRLHDFVIPKRFKSCLRSRCLVEREKQPVVRQGRRRLEARLRSRTVQKRVYKYVMMLESLFLFLSSWAACYRSLC